MTTAALLLLAQLTAVTPQGPAVVPTSITVRANGGAVTVPVLTTGSLHGVRADLLARALGGSIRAPAPATHASAAATAAHAPVPTAWYTLTLPGITLRVADHDPFARADSTTIPLDGEPYVVAGQLVLPYAVVTDVLPRVASGVLYDPERGELRVFSAMAPATHRTRSGDVLVTDSSDLEASALPGKTHLVVVDAGHGGPDHGMSGPIGAKHQVLEKDITLAVALRLASALRGRGIQVVMTRTRDTLIALSDRGRIANEHHGDLFVSIHVNAANPAWHDPAGARGFETYFLAEAKTEDARRVADMENEAVRFETSPDGSGHDPLSFIMQDMKQNEHLRESSELAAIIQQRLGAVSPGPSRGVKQAGFRVLVTAYMPAVLVEIGFGTNAAEAHFLTDPAAQRRLAQAIAGATSEYLTRYERRVGTTSLDAGPASGPASEPAGGGASAPPGAASRP